MAFIFYPKDYQPKYDVRSIAFRNRPFDELEIPPNTVVRHDGYFRLNKAARIDAFQPHMHMRGKAMTLEAILPDNSVETLSSVDHFDFNWHVSYLYADGSEPLLPAGTVLHMIGIHDNTANNKRNPDPTMWAGFGERSVDDMLQVWLNVVYFDEPEYQRLVAERAKSGGRLPPSSSNSDRGRPRSDMMRRQVCHALAAGAVVVGGITWTAPALRGQSGTKNGEWRAYGGDLGHTRYAPLDQIDAANFSTLEVAWRFKTDSLGPRPEYNLESTPLMVGGRLFSTGGTRRSVVALDAATGELLWVHGENEGARGAAAPRQLSGRGLAYWTDGKEERILYVTPGYRLVALDAKTGQPATGFGARGIVDLKQDFDQIIDLTNAPVGLHSTPMVARDVVIVGAAFETGANPRSKANVKGYVRGFDVRTGKRLWLFHTIPRPGEFGNETWLNDSWSYTGNTGVWAQISIDEQLGLAYLPVELPTHDYYGGARPGDNLFSESIIAVDLRTGRRKWHYQLVHHGLWDMDIPCAPILADITVNGRTVKALAQPTKQAFLYVFNRETGEPIWPIEERPVPKGDTPGEWYAPTQPFPTKPPAYDGQGLTVNDLIDFTPELSAEAEKVVARYRLGPMFTPPSVSRIEGPIATLTMGAQAAATNWPGGSYDPETHTVFVASQTSVATLGLVPPPAGVSDLPYHQGTVLSGARRTGGSGSGAAATGAARAPAPSSGGDGGAGAEAEAAC